MKRNLLVLAVMIVAVLFFTPHNAGAQCPEDPIDLGYCDTLVVETFDGDHIYQADSGSFDTVRVAIYVVHDSNTFYWETEDRWVQDSIACFVIPLTFWHQPEGCADSVILPAPSYPEWWNNTANNSSDGRMGRSIFRNIVDEHTCCDTTYNRMLWLGDNWLGWATRIIDIEEHSCDGDSGHFFLSLIPGESTNRRWWESPYDSVTQTYGRVLLATLTFKVYMSDTCNTTELGLDSTFWPPAGRLRFTRHDAHVYYPRHYLPVKDTIYRAECGWISFDGSPPLTPPDVEVIECDPTQTVLRIITHGMCVEDTIVGADTFQLITIPEMTSTGEDGRPRLPAIGELIGLSTLADTVEIIDISTSHPCTLCQPFHVFPLQLQTRCEYEPPFTMDTSFYSDSNYFYPPSVAEAGPVNFWHILPTSNVGIFPFQYNAVTDTLIVYDTIWVTLSHVGSEILDAIARTYLVLYKNLINEECVFSNLMLDMEKFEPHKLFIVADNLDEDTCVKKLMDYEKRKGFDVEIMTATEAGGSPPDPDSIKKTIKAFYGKPECKAQEKYVVLIGDHPEVPSKVSTFGLDAQTLGPDPDVLSDEWYELMGWEGRDYLPDLFLGRLPTSNPDTLCKIIDKKIKNDTTGHDNVTKELLVAHKMRFPRADPGDGSPKEYVPKETKELVKNKLTDKDLCGFEEDQVIRVYGSDGGTNNNVKDAIENDGGVGMVNYVGHGLETEWDRWDANNHSWTKTWVSGLQDSCKEPIVWSIACLNNKIDYRVGGNPEDCIGEHWIKQCKATAHFGASRTVLIEHSNYLDNFIHETICKFKKNNETADLGHIINKAKVELAKEYFKPSIKPEDIQDKEYAKFTILEYLLLGDPEQTVWTEVPKQPDVGHESSIATGAQQFTVSVQESGTPVEGAIVCLWKKADTEDEVFKAVYTDESGQATFDIDPQTSGVMYVTVWGKNLKVYFGEVPVHICGDANGDGTVDVGDVIYLINYLFTGTSPPDPLCVGDVNRDGVVDVGDVIYLINYLFTGTSPPCSE